jgi:hypothetical protein
MIGHRVHVGGLLDSGRDGKGVLNRLQGGPPGQMRSNAPASKRPGRRLVPPRLMLQTSTGVICGGNGGGDADVLADRGYFSDERSWRAKGSASRPSCPDPTPRARGLRAGSANRTSSMWLSRTCTVAPAASFSNTI